MRQFLTIFTVLLFFSCERPVDIVPNSTEHEVVLNSVISTDSVWNVNLSYSKSIFDNHDFELINDAQVKVNNLTNGQGFYLENKGNGCYGRALNPTEGHNYELVVTMPSGKEIRGVTYVPSVLEVNVNENYITDNEGLESLEIDIEIEDTEEEDNFYVWEIIENVIETNEPGTNAAPDIFIDINETRADDGNEPEISLKTLNSQIFITDKEFEGKSYAAKVTIGNEILNPVTDPSNPNTVQKARFSLRVMAVSAELYEYLRTYELYKQNEIKVTSISQPITIYSNIENGLGIFGGYLLKEFPID